MPPEVQPSPQQEHSWVEDAPPEVRLSATSWSSFGHDLYNTRHNPGEVTIGANNVKQLAQKWSWSKTAVTSTPSYYDGKLYFVDWEGNRVALDAKTGTEAWRVIDPANAALRFTSSPTVEPDSLYFASDGGIWYRAARATGAIDWSVKVDDGGSSQMYSSLTRIGDLVIAGVASYRNVNLLTDVLGEKPFAGSIVARNYATGAEVWKFKLTTGEGVGVCSTPAIDPVRKRLFAGTGNNYDKTNSVYADSLIALDYETGKYAWHQQYTEGDEYSGDVLDGPDKDLLATPVLFTVDGVPMVGAGDKGGSFRVFERADGRLKWMRQLSAGGHHGGVMGSPAYHAGAVYVCSGDFTADVGDGIGQSGPARSTLFALNAASGEVIWSTPIESLCYGAISHANGLVYLPAGDGYLRVFDDRSGSELWSANLGGSSAGGVSIVDGMVYVSYGWDWFLPGVPGGVKAFGLP